MVARGRPPPRLDYVLRSNASELRGGSGAGSEIAQEAIAAGYPLPDAEQTIWDGVIPAPVLPGHLNPPPPQR